MTAPELKRIEEVLGITLPHAYKKVLVAFPVPAYAGNSELMLWDDAEALIALNHELRTGSRFVKPWPQRFFALGRDAGGCSDALDLTDPEFGVFWFDRGHIHATDDEKSPEKIEQWLTRQVRDLSSDLAGDGIDPASSPQKRKEQENQEYRSSHFAAFLFIGIIALALLIGIWIGMKK